MRGGGGWLGGCGTIDGGDRLAPVIIVGAPRGERRGSWGARSPTALAALSRGDEPRGDGWTTSGCVARDKWSGTTTRGREARLRGVRAPWCSHDIVCGPKGTLMSM